MKICSLWKIEFVVTQGANAGQTYVLLDFEDKQEENEPQFSPSQGNAASTAIFFSHGSNYALGGTHTQLTWTRWREYDAPHLARSGLQQELAAFPFGQQGFIRTTVRGGDIWEYYRSIVISPVPTIDENDVLFTYSAQLGEGTWSGLYLEDIAMPSGTPAFWEYLSGSNCPNWEDITTNWEDISTIPVI